MSYLLTLFLTTCLSACPPGEPGTVVVVDGEAQAISFSVEGGIDCRLTYDTSRLALWFDEGFTQPIPPDTIFQAPPAQIAHGDMNDDTKVNGADVQLFVDVFLGIETDPGLIDQADFDENGFVDMADVPRFVAALLDERHTGDMNGDERLDGNDVQPFLNVLLDAPLVPGDFDEDGDVDPSDLGIFADVLLGIETDPDLIDLADLNGDGRSDGDDVQGFVQAFLIPASAAVPNPSEGDLDYSGVVDLADVPLFINALLFGIAEPDTTLTLFAEGLAPSDNLCDTPIDLLADREGDGTFSPTDTHETTVVQITITPSTVQLGTAIVATLQPASGNLVFDSTTTVTWSGDYVPTLGSPVPLTIAYDAEQVRESSDGEATLVAGDGTISVSLSAFSSAGTLSGSFTFDLGGILVSASRDFLVGETQARLHEISQVYDEDENVSFILGPPAEEINVSPGPVPSEEVMIVSIFNHYAVVVPVAKNATTLDGPTNLTVEVVTMDGTLTVVQDNFEMTLSRLPDDTDPNYILYASDIDIPLFPINVEVDRSLFTQVIPFQTVDDGFVVIVPQEVLP